MLTVVEKRGEAGGEKKSEKALENAKEVLFGRRKGGGLYDQLEAASDDLTMIDPAKLGEAIRTLTELQGFVQAAHEMEEVAAEDLRGRITEMLSNPRAAKVERVRGAFSDFANVVERECAIPIIGHTPKYSITGNGVSAKDLDDEDYDPDAVYVLHISHLEFWGDGDYDYGGGGTDLAIKLDKSEGLEYEFTGDEIDEAFRQNVVRSISKIAEDL